MKHLDCILVLQNNPGFVQDGTTSYYMQDENVYLAIPEGEDDGGSPILMTLQETIDDVRYTIREDGWKISYLDPVFEFLVPDKEFHAWELQNNNP